MRTGATPDKERRHRLPHFHPWFRQPEHGAHSSGGAGRAGHWKWPANARHVCI